MIDAPRGTFDTDVARVRLVLMRELETISVYEALAREAQLPEAKAFFEHLAFEEKEHVAEATYLLRKLDAAQETRFQGTYSESHFQGATASAEGSADATSGTSNDAPAQNAASPSPPSPFIPEEHRFPLEPHRALYALSAAPSHISGALTVGSLKGKT
jgi:hypothetical protein